VKAKPLRGLEDRETQDRKRLLRDVRSPGRRILDAFSGSAFQTGGIFTSLVGMFVFPAYATPFFLFGLFLFALRCFFVNNERLPFRCPSACPARTRATLSPGAAVSPNRKDCFSLATVCRTSRNYG
jgi:intracellular multiplication protein IcmO